MADTGNMRSGFDQQLANLMSILQAYGQRGQNVRTNLGDSHWLTGTISDIAGVPGDAAVLAQKMGLLPKDLTTRPLTGQEMRPHIEQIFGSGPDQMAADLGYNDIPGFADGGRPEVGQPAIVGENGPELFVPDQPGTVVPRWLLGNTAMTPPSNSFLDRSLVPLFMQSAAVPPPPQAAPQVPSFMQSGLTEAPPPASLPPTGGALQGYEQYSPNEIAAMRMERGARVPSRYQPPPPPGMTAAETGDVVRRAAFGDPNATVPEFLTRPPSTWSPEEQQAIYDASVQTGLMATPAAMAKPIASIANTALDVAKAAPKTTGATLGTGAALVSTTEAGDKASDFRGRAAELQPEIDSLRKRIETNQNKLVQLSTTQVAAGRSKAQQKQAEAQSQRLGTGTAALNETLNQDRSRLKELEGQRDALQTEALAAEARGRPLIEQHPWMKYGPVIGGIIAGATAMDPRLRAVRQYNQTIDAMAPRLSAVEAAAARAGTNVTNADRLAATQLEAYRSALPAMRDAITPSLGREFGEMGKAAVPGAFVGAELGMLPSQVDLVSQGKDTPAYQAALDRFTTAPGWAKTGLNAFVGMTGGSLGAGVPTSWFGARPGFVDNPRVQGALQAFESRMQGWPGRGSPAPTSPPSPGPSPMSSPTLPALPAPSRRPIFDPTLSGGRGGWRDPITGNITRAPRTP